MRIVLDAETNGLKPDLDRIWCVAAKDIDTGAIYTFIKDEVIEKLPAFLDKATLIVVHNGIDFDRVVIKKLLDYEIPMNKIEDTMVMSRLADPVRDGGHSLALRGYRRETPAGA